ncbi:MAG TPA: hypothetical protein VIA06_13240 [Candidatus Dormibacteraeota bacterium]|nr:hypothetical protein [Candidatus Dormibacteraeota bacterium]
MGDPPGAVDLPQAERGPGPHALFLAVAGALDPLEAVAEGHALVHRDAQLGQLDDGGAIPGVQPPLQAGGVEHGGA